MEWPKGSKVTMQSREGGSASTEGLGSYAWPCTNTVWFLFASFSAAGYCQLLGLSSVHALFRWSFML
jgi:hypothetical protein